MQKKLFTKAIENALKKTPLNTQKDINAKVIARFYHGYNVFYVLSGKKDTLYGAVSFGYGFEFKIFSRVGLEAMRFTALHDRNKGVHLERDNAVKPLKNTLEQCMIYYREHFMI